MARIATILIMANQNSTSPNILTAIRLTNPKIVKKTTWINQDGQDDYEYDPLPNAYAGWLFRSGAQDGPSNAHKVLRVVSLGNNWYQYTFLDMGIKCTNKVKVIKIGNKLLFDEIKQGKI